MTIMPRRIRILDATLANQIAAGEVIERPASVLKELLENSIDAGATQIRVAIEHGGSRLIQVQDNGGGIHGGDLELALQRHATSKISTLSELEGIQSLGFRGEALPSIASVARLRLESQHKDDDSGWVLNCDGGTFTAPPAPFAHPPGTTVSVRDLFYNTPARRKFLRTRRTELQQIETLFKRIALMSFDVRLELVHDGRSLLRLPRAGNAVARRQRLSRILGKGFNNEALEVDTRAGGLQLRGWVGAPSFCRDRNNLQYLYINDRAVNDPVCRHAVRLAYDDLLPPGQHPAWVLYLEIDPQQVDVNVHPAKQEVRFHEARMVHDFIRSGVRAVLTPDIPLSAPADPLEYPLQSVFSSAGAGSRTQVREPSPVNPVPTSCTSAANDKVQGLHLFDERWWLGQFGGKLHVADIQAVARILCLEALEHLLTLPEPQNRPLLLPAGLNLTAKQATKLDQSQAALARLGLELRISGPGRGMLLAVPLALAQVPGEILAECLLKGLDSIVQCTEAKAWIEHLACCAGCHPEADMKRAGQMIAHLLEVHEAPPGNAWRELLAGDLARWLQERA